MSKYRKKPVIIEAIQWNGLNDEEIYEFTHGKSQYCANECRLFIPTLEGTHEALVGDFIIRGVKGEYYPCKPDIFEQTYELVEAENG